MIFHASNATGPMPIAGGLNDNRALQMTIIALIALPGYFVAVWQVSVSAAACPSSLSAR